MSNKSNLQSNNDSLSANNLDLQSLIDQANTLPDAGGGIVDEEAIVGKTIKRLSDSGQIGYEEETLVGVVPETTADFVPMENLGGLLVIMVDVDPTPGATYTIKWDGVEYVCVADANGFVGNRGIIGEEDTGEPFVVTYGGVGATTEGEHTFSVTEHQTTVHPMAPKWLPSVRESNVIMVSVINNTSYDVEAYDFPEFAQNGVLDFFATCRLMRTPDPIGNPFYTRFIAVDIDADGRVSKYMAMPVFHVLADASYEDFFVEINVREGTITKRNI